MAGTSQAVSSGPVPRAPPSVRRSRPSTPAPVPQANAPRRMLRYPRLSPRPPRPCRRCGEPASRRPLGNPLAIPCQSARGISARVLPSLSHVTRSGVSEPFLTLLDLHQWSRLASFPYRSRPRAPSLRRHYPASSVIQAPPPPRPARPVPRGIPVGACHTTDGASRVASSFLFHACQRQYPGGSGQCFHRSLPGRHRSSPFPRRVDSHIARFGACSAFTHVPACMLAEPPIAVLLSECFNPCRYLHESP